MLLTVDDDFALDKTAESGQCFRWERTENGEYRIIHRDRCLYISRRPDGRFLLDCREEDFDTVWREYFDLDTDYRSIRSRIDQEKDPFLYAAAESEKGIRILRQDPWETAVSFIISQNRNIPAIKRSIALLCRFAGTRKLDKRGEPYDVFPGPESVLSMSCGALEQCRLGYRDKYVLAAAEAACGGAFSPAEMDALEDGELMEALGRLHGVGPKVASCIALYGFHRLDAFPVDTWIKKALKKEYTEGFPFERYRPYNGVLQQYIFAYCRNAGA